MDKEKQILQYIRMNPFISQQELANKIGISRSAVAGYIANLTRQGKIKGRAYVLADNSQITCIGGANIDRKARSMEKVKFHSSNPVIVTESYGGVARNIAENLGRLGCTTSLITAVGDDQEGKWILQETQTYGVDVSQAWILPSEKTGSYTALLDINGEMVIALANMEIYEKIRPNMLAEKWSHIATSKAIFLDTNIPADSIAYIIQRCKEENIPLFIDPVSSTKAKKLPQSLDGVDTILPNREEAEVLAEMNIATLADYAVACNKIKERGVRNVVITLGEQGIFYSSQESAELIPPIKVDIVDVTGAGDAFASGFLYGIVQDETFPQACQIGLVAASITLQSEQSASPILNETEINSVLNLTRRK